jgi:hypothetical protein
MVAIFEASNSGSRVKDLGELEEARDLAKKAYNTYLNLFGPNHPGTRTIKGNFVNHVYSVSNALAGT